MNVIRQVKNELRKSWNFPLVGALLLIYGFLVDRNLSIAVYYNMSALEYTLYGVTDHYYLMYGYFFFLMFYITNELKGYSALEIIRFGSVRSYHKIKILGFSFKFAVFILLHIFIAFAIGATKLQSGNVFIGSDADILYGFLESTFVNPLTGVIITSLYLWFGSIFVYRLSLWVKITSGSKGFVIYLLCMFLSMIIGFTTGLDDTLLGGVFLNNYLIFHHSYGNGFSLGFIIIVCMMIALPSLCTLPRKRKTQNQHIYANTVLGGSMGVTIIFVTSLAVLHLIIAVLGGFDPLGFVFVVLRGFSLQNFNLIELLLFLSFFVIPIFIICMKWDDEKDYRNNIGEFRYGSKKKWQLQKNKIHHFFLARYVMSYYGVVALVFFGLSLIYPQNTLGIINDLSAFYGITSENLEIIFVISTLLKVMELYFLFLLANLLHRLIKSSTLTFIATFIGYALIISLPTASAILPFGISSMYGIMENQTKLMYGALPLILWIVALIIVNKIWRKVL